MMTRFRLAKVSLLLTLPPSLPGLLRTLRLVRKRSWDGVHLHGEPSTLVDLVGVFARLRGRSFVMTFHGVLQNPRSLGRIGYPLYRAIAWLERWVFSGALALTAVSGPTLRDVVSAGFRAPRMLVIPNSISTDFAREMGASPSEGAVIEDPGGKPLGYVDYALCLGAYTPRKGQRTALEAFAGLVSNPRLPKSFELVFAGYERDPSYLLGLRRMAAELGVSERVRFFGPITEDRKFALMRSARWILIPSTYEASSLVAMEAMLVGGVLVVSDLDSVGEVIGEPANAAVFRAGDATGLRSVLTELLQDPARESRLREAARRRLRSLPNWEEVAARYLAVLATNGNPPSDG